MYRKKQQGKFIISKQPAYLAELPILSVKDGGASARLVEVNVTGEFEREGSPATGISYSVRIKTNANEDQVLNLIRHTDQMAEAHHTLRVAKPVQLSGFETME